MGACERLRVDSKDQNLKENIRSLATALVESFNSNHTSNWKWFESILTYDNARIPQALLMAHQSLGSDRYLKVARETLDFLQNVTEISGIYAPVGSKGWYAKGGTRALYDQQPVDAGAMVETTCLAYQQTRSEVYEKLLRSAFGWYFGSNTKSVAIYDEQTGACYDGVMESGRNENQGAESVISFLLAAVSFLDTFPS
jgi:hypothetical protein